jgi:hypothetical protein
VTALSDALPPCPPPKQTPTCETCALCDNAVLPDGGGVVALDSIFAGDAFSREKLGCDHVTRKVRQVHIACVPKCLECLPRRPISRGRTMIDERGRGYTRRSMLYDLPRDTKVLQIESKSPISCVLCQDVYVTVKQDLSDAVTLQTSCGNTQHDNVAHLHCALLMIDCERCLKDNVYNRLIERGNGDRESCVLTF